MFRWYKHWWWQMKDTSVSISSQNSKIMLQRKKAIQWFPDEMRQLNHWTPSLRDWLIHAMLGIYAPVNCAIVGSANGLPFSVPNHYLNQRWIFDTVWKISVTIIIPRLSFIILNNTFKHVVCNMAAISPRPNQMHQRPRQQAQCEIINWYFCKIFHLFYWAHFLLARHHQLTVPSNNESELSAIFYLPLSLFQPIWQYFVTHCNILDGSIALKSNLHSHLGWDCQLILTITTWTLLLFGGVFGG